jgi:hypothetical protein
LDGLSSHTGAKRERLDYKKKQSGGRAKSFVRADAVEFTRDPRAAPNLSSNVVTWEKLAFLQQFN